MHQMVAKNNQPQLKSLAFFHQPEWDAEITPIGKLNKGSVISGDYLIKKLNCTHV